MFPFQDVKNATPVELEQAADQYLTFLEDGKKSSRPLADQVTTCLLAVHNMDDVFSEELLNKIEDELPEEYEPRHEETAFNVLRALRYWNAGKPVPSWVKF